MPKVHSLLRIKTTLNATSFHDFEIPLSHLQGLHRKPLKFHVIETAIMSILSQAYTSTTWRLEGAQIQVLCCCGCTLILPIISQIICGWTGPLGIARHTMPFEFEKLSLSAFEILLPEGKPKFEEMSSKHKTEIESVFARDKRSKVSSRPWLIVTDPKNLQGTYVLLNGDPKCCG